MLTKTTTLTCFLVCLAIALAPLTRLSAQAPKSYALLVGLSEIDDSAYAAQYKKKYSAKATSGVPLDLYKMNLIAEASDHEVTILTDHGATREKVLQAMETIGKQIKAEDFFMLYYSGHGDQVPDKNGDEVSGLDQVLVTYNDFLVDDDIYNMFRKHFTKSKNIMIVDACHSASSYKFFMDFGRDSKLIASVENTEIAEQQSEKMVDCSTDPLPVINEPFNLIYFGATEDFNTAQGDIDGGLLTVCLDRIYRKANLDKNWRHFTYRKLACQLQFRMQTYYQNLQYHEIGTTISTYSAQTPFKNQ